MYSNSKKTVNNLFLDYDCKHPNKENKIKALLTQKTFVGLQDMS